MSDGIKRRDFLKVLGAGSAGATVFGCSTGPAEKLIPYVVPDEQITPGVATWYTSVCSECPAGCGIRVRTREGRAVKVEGNPNHPISQGGLCSRGQASLQGLYDPDRADVVGPMLREGGQLRSIGWDEAEQLLATRLQEARGQGIFFITGKTGASFGDLVENFVSAAGGTHIECETLSEAPLREATRIAFGRNVVPSFELSQARFILSFGADFLETWLSPVRHTRGFADSSAVDEYHSKGRFVFVGPRLSLTGQNADEWVPIRAGHEAVVALAMARIIAEEGGSAGPYGPVLEAYDPESVAEPAGISADDIRELARRFVEEGPAVAVGPGLAGHHRNATAANLAVMILNSVAGYVGRTVLLRDADLGAASTPYSEMENAISSLAGAGVVMVHGANPAYSLPPAAGFSEAFRSGGFKVSFASALDETARMADLILPDRHFLEAWGDSNPRPTLFALQQPVMQPVPHFDSKQTGDVLLSVAFRMDADLGATTFYDYVRNRWVRIRNLIDRSVDFDEFWREALRRGVVSLGDTGAEGAPVLRSPDRALSFDAPPFDGDASDPVLMVYPSSRFGDGSLANRPWLLELPDPVSKITWHSWVEVHPDAAARLGVEDGDIVRVRSEHGELEVPVWIYPGIRPDVVAIAMGGGHDGFGRFADGNGVNPMVLLSAESEEPSGSLVLMATRVSLEPTGERRRLASIEGDSGQHERPIAPAVGLAAISGASGGQEEHGPGEEGEAGGHGHGELQELQAVGGFVPVPTGGEPADYPLEGSRHGQYDPEENPRWAMAIDLDRCTGCSACITACQSENNVPWVGEEQILMGRDMHWVRLERYYEHVDAAHAGDVDVRHLPMICQQCGNAPCEPVCPVYAAYHTPEGLNAQVYNRCVGTRYCANNCPYKVRVFNWFTFTDVPEPMNWQYNPDVTVRENGVMEKCSFCVQRIRDVQNRARIEGRREVGDGEIVPACQQSCPARAITFGDARDQGSRVSRAVEDERAHRVLDELINTQPAVSYLKKVTFHEVEPGEH